MAIYIFNMEEKSRVIFKIEASNLADADQALERYLSNDAYLDEYYDHMSSNCQNRKFLDHVFMNEDEFNKSGIVPDFTIDDEAPGMKEPIYNLHFNYNSNSNHKLTKAFDGITMQDVLLHLSSENKKFKLIKTNPSYIEIAEANKCNATPMIFDCIERVK